MTEISQFSYSFEVETPSDNKAKTGEPAAVKTFAYTDVDAVQLSERHLLVLDRHKAGSQLLTPEVAVALEQHCTRFQTLQQHAEAITGNIPQLAGQMGDVSQVLDQVAQSGLFRGADDVCREWTDAGHHSDVDSPVRVFVITCDRPAAVERLFASLMQSPGLSAAQQLILVDDSRQGDNALANRQLVDRFRPQSPVPLKYVGDEEIAALAHQLENKVPQATEAIRFLLDRGRWRNHKTYGLSRNVALLLSVGCRSIVFDDDAVCRGVPSTRASSQVFVTSDARELDLYPTLDALRAQLEQAGEEDPIQAQISVLGRNQAQAVEVLQGRGFTGADLAGMDYRFLGRLNPSEPVLVAECGSVGDSGAGSKHFLHRLSSASVKRALSAPGGLQGALDSQFMRLARDRPTFTPQAMMSAMTGLDNSHLLPPYMPVFRGEDFIFGAMLLHLYPYSAVLDLNLAVPHLPIENRVGSRDSSGVAAAGGVSILGSCIRDSVSWVRGPSPLTRLQRLSQLLLEMSESSDAELTCRYRRELANENSNQFHCIEEALNNAEVRDDEWLNYLKQSRQEVSAALMQTGSPQDAPGVPQTMTESELLGQVRSYLKEFSECLALWPQIREAAADYQL